MYAKLVDGKLLRFEGNKLSYSLSIGDRLYHVSVINPSEEELREAGYLEVMASPEQIENNSTVYMVDKNIIVPVREVEDEDTHEETDIQ